jgi:hypothetical protein
MMHVGTHDPIVDHRRCLVCNQALSAAFAVLADMDLGPNGSGRLVEVLRAEANKAVALGAAS